MGLLKAGIGALKGVLSDQWRDYFYAEALPANVLVTKAQKRVTKRFGGSRVLQKLSWAQLPRIC